MIIAMILIGNENSVSSENAIVQNHKFAHTDDGNGINGNGDGGGGGDGGGTAAAVSSTVSSSVLQSASMLLSGDVNVPSTQWSPLVIRECTEAMPSHWAPCLIKDSPNSKAFIEMAEELIFPDFSISFPQFLDDEMKQIFVEDMVSRGLFLKDNRVQYLGQHGQNLIVRNGEYDGDPPVDAWTEAACMGADVLHQGLFPSKEDASNDGNGDGDTTFESVILATTPNAWSFQHFLDRVTHVLEQVSTISAPSPFPLPSPSPSPPPSPSPCLA